MYIYIYRCTCVYLSLSLPYHSQGVRETARNTVSILESQRKAHDALVEAMCRGPFGEKSTKDKVPSDGF